MNTKDLTLDIIYDMITNMRRKFYTLEEDLEKRLKDPEFRKEWEESEPDYQLACRLIEARIARKMSQRDLAKKVGTSQAAISRIEAMNGNPSLSLLKRVANALNSKLQISFS